VSAGPTQAGSVTNRRTEPVRCLIAEEEIRQVVGQIGRRISEDYRDRQLTLLGVLTGSIILVADLMRQITLPHKLGLLQASSYRGTATEPGQLTLNLDLLPNITGRDVLLVDDILDTGRTMQRLMDEVQERGAASVRCAVLLWKKCRTVTDLRPDYFGFEIPDEFVVGYGLDYDDEFRHLPFIGVIGGPMQDGPVVP
jgi:hypoxanthine phosphoribosyltransferase